jgi:hypothetical protein
MLSLAVTVEVIEKPRSVCRHGIEMASKKTGEWKRPHGLPKATSTGPRFVAEHLECLYCLPPLTAHQVIYLTARLTLTRLLHDSKKTALDPTL